MKYLFHWIIDKFRSNPPSQVAVIKMTGVIAASGRMGQSINLENQEKLLQTAFSISGVTAVALSINSPGGSPVQSELILQRIRQLADKKDIPVLVFCEDVAASGGYMLAIAGDEIYANKSSILGSIGVIYSGFGFDKAIEKLGISRRLYTAGESKALLDPFSPEKEEDIKRLKDLQKEIHEHFKDLVKKRRGKRLKNTKDKLFNGDVWMGEEAVKLGLIDGIGEMRATLKERFGEDVRIRELSQKKPRLAGLLGLLRQADSGSRSAGLMGPDWANDLLDTVETRSFWSRWGL